MHRFVWLALLPALTACSSSTTMVMPDPPNYGAACTSTSECHGGTVCATGLPTGGFCSAMCSASPTSCGTTGHCSSWFGTPLCLGTCSVESDCRAGFQCWRSTCVGLCGADLDCAPTGTCGADMRCTGPECATAVDCGAGRTCSAGRCVTPASDGGPSAGNEGDPCTGSIQCMGTLVCLPAGYGGTCARTCTTRSDCGSPDLVCVPAPIDRDGDGTADATTTACIADDSTLRRNGQLCSSAAACETRLCLGGECLELCASGTDCLPGQACVPGLSVPGAPPGTFAACGFDAATVVENVDIPLGSFSVSRTTESPPITFAVDPQAVSVSLIAQQTTGAPQTIAFLDLYDASATHLYSIMDIESYTDPPLRWIPAGTEGIGTMIDPNTTSDRIAFSGGRHVVTFGIITDPGVTSSSNVTLTARVKRAPGGVVSSGTLDIDVWTLGTGLSAASAPGDAFLQTALTEMRSLYAGLGITIGTVRYVDVSAGDRAAYHLISSVDGPTSELSQMFTLSGGRTDNVLDLFVVDRIEVSSGEGLVTLGIAGGIPGPPGVHGTPHSGVAVIYDQSIIGGGTGGAHRLGQVMAHECGHYLGFFHTTEGARACAAGEIPSATDMCAPFGGGDVIADTVYGDTTNVMYWAAMGGRTLTAGQSYVALRNPLVH